jgi:hypothetical protein
MIRTRRVTKITPKRIKAPREWLLSMGQALL